MKRPSIKGLGAKLFETDAASTSSQQHNGTTARQQETPKYPKATFYLPASMLERLDKAWIARRNRDRRVKKSDLVREALDTYLAEHEQRRTKSAN